MKAFEAVSLATMLASAVLVAPVSWAQGQLTASGDPASKLVGDWALTVFVMGGSQPGGLRCGRSDRPGPSPVTIAPPRDSGVSLTVACNDGSDYAFRLKRGTAAHAGLLTVKSKQGISVDDFPVGYVEGQGWTGVREQLVKGKKVPITVTVAPIEGRNWYGWMIAVLPTADINRSLDNIKTPYFRVDLTRRK
jgi:hypothetical protein